MKVEETEKTKGKKLDISISKHEMGFLKFLRFIMFTIFDTFKIFVTITLLSINSLTQH